MQHRPLGRSGVNLSALGFGCMTLIGWYGTRNDEEARATLLSALDQGVTHLDTAASYQLGENEKFVGATIRGRRDGLFLATKYGITRNAQGQLVIDNKPQSLRTAVESSLTRLGTDRIDLFYLHRIDPATAIEESVGALADLVRTGKIRHVGLSECSVQTLRRAHAVHPVAAVQSEYSLWSREPEQGILPACRELGVGLVAYSPLGRGFLAANFRSLADLPADDNRRNQPRFSEANAAHNARLVTALAAFAARKGCSLPQLAIAWVLAQGPEVTAIPGMKTRAHLHDNLGALDVGLSAAECQELRTLVAEHPVRGERHPAMMMKTLDA
ncbi:MAG TPA: aldo/keto reductase [Steroidobacteraceae bacterium]|nr:aldo/keto reductase [Steroidobacteraceae bacterium]